MSNVLKMLSRGGAAAAETDPNFNQTVLLLHGDGTNGAQNNTFLDGSTNNFTITRNGNTTQGTFSPFSVGAGEWSNYFDGSGDYLSGPTDNAISTFTGDFTIEMWANFSSIAASSGLMQCLQAGPPELGWQFYWRQANTSFRLYSSALGSFDFSYTPTVGSWIHIALSRSGTSLRCFVNGTQVGTTQTMSGTVTRATVNSLQIGGGSYAITSINGYLSNVRLVNGTAVYTSAFTPSTTPLTNITNTSLLTCQSNRFVDNSSNAFAITRNGDVRVTHFSPFAPSAAYSAGTNGGSGYFDGTGDYLSSATGSAVAFGTGAFSFELWVYLTDLSGVKVLLDTRGGGTGVAIYTNGATANVALGASALFTGASLNLNEWTHLAVTRSGTTLAFFVNGSRYTSTTDTTNFGNNTTYIGTSSYSVGGNLVIGYLSNARIVKGTAVYDPTQTTCPVPTTPFTSDSNTSLLLNFTNAGIFDNTGKNNLETVGNAQIDTTTKKYGTGSMEFDGTGDYLVMPSSVNFGFGTGDFTIEAWIYTTSSATQRIISSTGNNLEVLLVNTGANVYLNFFNGTSDFTTGANYVSQNTWSHIAVSRSGTTLRLFIDGVVSGTHTMSTDLPANPTLFIGRYAPSNLQPFFGYIDDLRITKGVARYTANFTPPTKEFPDL